MAEEAARSLTTHDEVDVDDMIATQIREMEKEIKSEYRVGDAAAPIGGKGEEASSMAFGHGSLDLSKSYDGFEKKATLRDSLRSSLGLSIGGERPAEPRIEGTGLKGLLMSDFRLDASLDNVGEAIGGGFVGRTGGGGYSPGRGSHEGHLAGVGAVNEDMEKLLKVLHDDENFQSGKQNDMHIGSIGQVADMLETEMAGFMKVVGEREELIDGVGIRDKERDEELREQGRAEARAKNLFGAAYTSATDITNAVANNGTGDAGEGDLPSYADATASPPVVPNRVDEVAALDAILGSESFVRTSGEGIRASAPESDAVPGSAGPLPPRYPMTSPPVTTPASFAAAVGPSPGDSREVITSLNRDGLNKALVAGWHPLQAAVDKEMSAADEILFRMRSLRTGLSSRLKHLDALSASVMTAQAGGNGDHPPSTGGGSTPSDAIETPAMLRSSREHWNGISRVSETAQAHNRERPLPQNVAPWSRREQAPNEGDVAHAANSLASTAKEIGSNLDGSLNRLLTRLTDPSDGKSESRCAVDPPPIPVKVEMPPFDVACSVKCSNYHFYGSCSHTDEISEMVRQNIVKALEAHEAATAATQAAAAQSKSLPVEEPTATVLDGFGPTLEDLNAPTPPKSILAQIDDLGNALGKSISVERSHAASSEVQAAAGTAFDKFLPANSRVNPFAHSGDPSSAPASSSSTSITGAKRKTLSPTPFRTKEAFVPPKLYAVHPARSEAVFQRDEERKKRIVAPSDEELILQERLSTSTAGGESSYVNIASAPAWLAKVPSLSPSTSYSSKYPGAPAISPDELPWASEGGTLSTLRTRPVEGLAILSQREEAMTRRKEEARKAEAVAIEKVAMGENSQRAPVMMPSVETGTDVAITEREKHLKAMRAMRLNLAAIL